MPKSSAHTAMLWTVAGGFFMQALDTTIINTALPSMAGSLGVSALEMHPVVVAYTLTMALLTPASGWLSDRFGSRRVYFVSILLFVLGSIFCALSQSLPQLVAARVVQGVGGAMLLPVGRLAVLRAIRARSAGLAVQPLSQWHMGQPAASGLLLGFTNIASPGMAAALVDRLARALGGRP